MKASKLLFSIMIAFSLSAFSLPVWAEKGGNGHGHGHSEAHKYENDRNNGNHVSKGSDLNVTVGIHIGTDDRTAIRNYITEEYHSNCPPGLAKKHNGCLPPGQAKKRYIVGQALPGTVVWEPVPSELLVRLQPVPVGYQYVRVDKDVLLISEASHKVIDAITLLSAVGK